MFVKLALLLANGIAARHHELRVYQGEMDSRNEFPFAVLLQLSRPPYIRICSGSLLSQTWVLTAAHCLTGQDAGTFIIRYHDFDKPMSNASHVRPIKLFVHPNYQLVEFLQLSSNDIALIYTENIPKGHGKLSALDYKTLIGFPVKYAGFGFTSEDLIPGLEEVFKNRITPLQVGEGLALSCERLGIKFGPAVCIVPKCSRSNQNARPGDSGGPLLYNGRVIGVAMSVQTTPVKAYYTPVSPFLSWILRTMQSDFVKVASW